MSRIYEALQRADRERQAVPDADGHLHVEPISLPSDQDMPPLQGDLDFERIAQQPWRPALPFFPALAERGVGVEQFRSLRSNIYQARYESPLKTILISSGMPSEGKSFVSANLAVSLSRNGINRILLIDGDLRKPTLHTLLGAPNDVGLSEYLAGNVELHAILQRQQAPQPGRGGGNPSLDNFIFIPAGTCGSVSSELLANHRIEDLIAAMAPHFDWILIDSPPVLAVSDAVEIAHAADAVLLIARGGSTPFDAAQRTQSTFVKARVLGFVLNDVASTSTRASYYGYYYEAPGEGHDARKGKVGRRAR